MSSLRLLSAFFCLILTLMLHAAPFPAPSSCGSFKIEKTEFLLHVFEKDWKMTRQNSQVLPKVSGVWQKDGMYRLQGIWNSIYGKLNLVQTITPQKENSFQFSADFEQLEGALPREISLGFAIDPGIYDTNPCMLDGKPLKFNKSYNGADWQRFYSRCKTLMIPMKKGILEIEGDFAMIFQDVRRFQWQLWGIRINAVRKDKKASLKLKFTYTPYQTTPVSIAGVCNMAFADEAADDGKGGWTDEGSANDMRKMPLGMNNFAGIDFSVIDPTKNKGVSCIALKGIPRPAFPASVTLRNIPQGKYFYLLHAVGWHNGTGKVGKVIFVMENGKIKSSDVEMQKDVGNFWNPHTLPNGAVGLETQNELSIVGLYVSSFEMPKGKIREIKLESYGKIVWLIAAASVSNTKIACVPPEKQTIRAGKNWQPIPNSKPVKSGSILDFSDLQDAPAGKYGRVKVSADGRLYFENAPKRKVRFYGANICHSTNYMEKKYSEQLVHNLSVMGYNSLRIHHIDSQNVHSNGKRSTEFSPEMLDRFDYLFSLCKKRGIYLTTDLYCWRFLTRGEVPSLGDWIPSPEDYRALVFLSDDVFENWKEFARNLLNHTNPYTKTKWKDDPTLWSLNLVNEDTILAIRENHPRYGKLYKQRFDEFVKSGKIDVKNASPRVAKVRFLTALYRERFQEMKRFLRKEIGTQILIADQNMWTDIPTTLMRDAFDVVDNHSYWDHPHFLERAWWLPTQLGSISGVMGFGGAASRLFPTRIFGKPFMVTEYDHVTPAFFAIDGAFIMGAYGAFQNWDGIYHFAYSHRDFRIIREEQQGLGFYFDLIGDVQRQFAERAGAVLFLRGDVNAAKSSVPTIISADHLKRNDILNGYPVVAQRAGLLTASGTVIAKNGRAVLPENAVAAIRIDNEPLSGQVPGISPDAGVEQIAASAGKYDQQRERFISDTGELILDRTAGSFSVITQKTEAFVLPEKASSQGKFIRSVKSLTAPYSACLVTARDNKPLEQSRRILLLHLTESKNSNMVFRDRNRTILEEWGVLPVLAHRGQLEIRFAHSLKGFRLWAVDIDGSRLHEIPLRHTEKESFFRADNVSRGKYVAAYELIKEK